MAESSEDDSRDFDKESTVWVMRTYHVPDERDFMIFGSREAAVDYLPDDVEKTSEDGMWMRGEERWTIEERYFERVD